MEVVMAKQPGAMRAAEMGRILSTPLRVGKHDPKKVVVADDGFILATMSWHMNDAEAYARLFAAAPDLFAALKRLADEGFLETLLGLDESTREDGEDEISGPAVHAALAAIAKAEGSDI